MVNARVGRGYAAPFGGGRDESRPYLRGPVDEGEDTYVVTRSRPYQLKAITPPILHTLGIVLANWPTDQPINYLEVSASNKSFRHSLALESQMPKPDWYSQ